MHLTPKDCVAQHSWITHRFIFFKGGPEPFQYAHVILQMTDGRGQIRDMSQILRLLNTDLIK